MATFVRKPTSVTPKAVLKVPEPADMSKGFRKGAAQLANLFGAALPPEFARARYSDEKQDIARAEARAFNDEVMKRAMAKMPTAPLQAICYNHVCGCGNSWQVFGHYAREVTESVNGAAPIKVVKALSYNPAPEQPAKFTWEQIEEAACIKCYGGPTVPNGPMPQIIHEPIAPLEQYRHMAHEDVEAIREKAIKQANALYTANAVKRIVATLPYGMAETITELQEMVAAVKAAADKE